MDHNNRWFKPGYLNDGSSNFLHRRSVMLNVVWINLFLKVCKLCYGFILRQVFVVKSDMTQSKNYEFFIRLICLLFLDLFSHEGKAFASYFLYACWW